MTLSFLSMSPMVGVLLESCHSVDVNDENDNRKLVDDVNHQTLQQEEIEQMRKDGVSGHVIVQELASSSVSFEGKTDFSKKKYLKKKSEKYIMRCMLVEANSQTVCEQQFMKLPVKIKCPLHSLFDLVTSVSTRSPTCCLRPTSRADDA